MKKQITNLLFLCFILSFYYNSYGQIMLDLGFSSDGKTNFDMSTTGTDLDECRGGAIQSDGKIVMVGYTYEGGITPKIAVARINADGTLDNTFNSDGRVVTNIGSANEEGKSVAIASDGKIYVTGFHNTGLKYNFAIVRYTTSGNEDLTFSTDGIESISLTSDDNIANCTAFQPDGKLLVAGYSGLHSDYGYPLYGNGSILLMRYDVVSQSLDLSFNTTGFVATDAAAGAEQITCMKVLSDGKILVAGEAKISTSASAYTEFLLARYNADGTIDNTFGTNGIVITSIGTKDDKINDLIVQPDGKIVVVGYTDNGSDLDAVVARYNSNGTLDNSFDGDGIKKIAIGTYDESGIGAHYDFAGGIIVGLRDGINSGDNQSALVRILENGSIDNGFGVFNVPISAGFASERPYAMMVQSDNKVVLVGKSKTNSGNNDFFALRISLPNNLSLKSDVLTNLSVFPNPSDGNFVLKINDNFSDQKVSIQLLNLQGQLIEVITDNSDLSNSEIKIELSGTVSSGMYYLKIATNESSQVIPIVIN